MIAVNVDVHDNVKEVKVRSIQLVTATIPYPHKKVSCALGKSRSLKHTTEKVNSTFPKHIWLGRVVEGFLGF